MDHHDSKNFILLSNIISEGDVLVDVGAHLGTYTDFFLSKLGNTGKVYSLELSQKTYLSLSKKYVNKNNIILLNKAVSDIDGDIDFYEAHDSHLNNIMGHDVLYNKHNVKGKTESVRLDTLLKNEQKIKLIKIDVEGAEHFVLLGLENIIDRVDYILVECHLQEYWNTIKNILINKYKLKCINNSADSKDINELNENSELMYQCFCQKSEK